MGRSKKDDGENFFSRYWLYLLAVVVVGVTLYALRVYPESGPWHGVLEATFVAALLTLTVDPFVKTRVAHEVNKDIFYHVIGFHLPEEMQDRLHDYLRSLKYYRQSLTIVVKAARCGDGVSIDVTETSRIVALTKCKYRQSLKFEDAEHGTVCEMYADQPAVGKRVVEWSASQTHPPAVQVLEPLTKFYQGPEMTLRKGNTLESVFHFELRGRKTDFWVQRFGSTTLQTTVTLYPLDGIKMYASGKENGKPGEELKYDQVFIIGDSLHIRWELPDNVGDAASIPSAPKVTGE